MREDLPTETEGTGATGWVTEPVVSCVFTPATRFSGPEFEAQPARTRQVAKRYGAANKRILNPYAKQPETAKHAAQPP